jgi:KDO2-lipid IV(A) lauroyltransferase
MHFGGDVICGQIYHALENKWFDKLFLFVRSRFGAVSVEKDVSFRTILSWKKSAQKNIVGYIADQVPGYHNIHRFVDFLNHKDTPVFTGAERISRLLDTDVFYGDIIRPKRGYYVCRLVKIAEHPQLLPTFFVTEQYTHLLEQTINRAPQYWLWSHNRWKRTKEEFERIYTKEEQEKHLNKL